MLKSIFIALLLFVFADMLFGETYYVNNAVNVSTPSGSQSAPFQKIADAVKAARAGDEIIIIGNHGGKQLIYSEQLVIPKELESLKITGNDNPVIDGSGLGGLNNAAFLVRTETVRITSLTVRNFTGGSIDELRVKGGAAFAFTAGLRDARIERNTIENCNYGMIFENNESLRISGNTLKGFPAIENDNPKTGGVGIMIFSEGKFIQDNYIGGKMPNTISGADYAAIYVGSTKNEVLADFTQITNNVVKDNPRAYGIVTSNIEGSCKITGNLFEGNKVAVFMKGANYDTFIERNTFKGSLSSSEIIADKSYSGAVLYSIWKHFDNVFDKATFAKIHSEDYHEILVSDGFMHIRTNEADAAKDAGDDGVVSK